MARPRKARVEGEAAPINEQVRAEYAAAAERADPAPGNNGEDLARIVEFFKAEHPDEWASIALCPLQHGLDAMVERLK